MLTRGQTHGGDLAVHGFFAISGYLITISWEKSAGALDYLRKRTLRILPGGSGDGGGVPPGDRANWFVRKRPLCFFGASKTGPRW